MRDPAQQGVPTPCPARTTARSDREPQDRIGTATNARFPHVLAIARVPVRDHQRQRKRPLHASGMIWLLPLRQLGKPWVSLLPVQAARQPCRWDRCLHLPRNSAHCMSRIAGRCMPSSPLRFVRKAVLPPSKRQARARMPTKPLPVPPVRLRIQNRQSSAWNSRPATRQELRIRSCAYMKSKAWSDRQCNETRHMPRPTACETISSNSPKPVTYAATTPAQPKHTRVPRQITRVAEPQRHPTLAIHSHLGESVALVAAVRAPPSQRQDEVAPFALIPCGSASDGFRGVLHAWCFVRPRRRCPSTL